jgi:hypothetical protein
MWIDANADYAFLTAWSLGVIEISRQSFASSSLPCTCSQGFSQKGFNIFPELDFHFRLREFKATRLNSDGGLFAAAIPAVICKPELAFDTQKRCHPKRYGVISQSLPPFRGGLMPIINLQSVNHSLNE